MAVPGRWPGYGRVSTVSHPEQINKMVKDLGIKGIQTQTQGDQVRVSGKKRDALQEVIAALKAADLDLPLQFTNFRD